MAKPLDVNTPHDEPAPPTRSFHTQKFAALGIGAHTVRGYSVAGEETVVQVPELGVCFDCGRAPQFALTSDILCISHGHMDHVAGLAYYISQRHFQGLKPPTILVPAEIADPIDDMLLAWRRIERQQTPYDLVEMRPGQMFRVRKDFGIRAHRTHHGGPSLGYAAIQIRHKLKDEFHDKSGDELRASRKPARRSSTSRKCPSSPTSATPGRATSGRSLTWSRPRSC